jgi:hypothetical protein
MGALALVGCVSAGISPRTRHAATVDAPNVNQTLSTPRSHAVESPLVRPAKPDWCHSKWCSPAPELIPWYPRIVEAAILGQFGVVKGELDRGVWVDTRETYKGHTALILAACFGYPDIVVLLLEAGADVTAKDSNKANAVTHCRYVLTNKDIATTLSEERKAKIRQNIALLTRTPPQRAQRRGRRRSD